MMSAIDNWPGRYWNKCRRPNVVFHHTARTLTMDNAGTKRVTGIADFGFNIMQKFARRKLPEALPILLDRKRVYILPTRFGVFFGVFLLVMLLGSLNYNNNLALLLCFLLSGLILMTPIYTVRNLVDLSIVRIAAPAVFAGQAARFSLTITNESANPRPVVWADIDAQPQLINIPGHDRAQVTVEMPATERGWLAMGRTRIFTRYPFGLCYAWCWLVPEVRCLVYPMPEEYGPDLPTGSELGTGQPERRGDEEWAGLRDYQAGDASRSIAWKVVARTDQLVTKTFAAHQSQEVTLDYAGLNGLAHETRIARLTRWVIEADKRGLHFALTLPQQTIGPGHGNTHKHKCLSALALLP